MSLYALPEDTTNIVLDYLLLEDLYKYATNPDSIQTFKEQVRRRTLNGDLSGLELAVREQDRNLARYVLSIIGRMPESQDVGYWNSIIGLAAELGSTMLLKEIIRASDPILVLDILFHSYLEFLAQALAEDPELIDIYLPYMAQRIIRRTNSQDGSRISFSALLMRCLNLLLDLDIDRMLDLVENLHSRGIYTLDDFVIEKIIRRSIQLNRVPGAGYYLPIREFSKLASLDKGYILSLLRDPNTTAKDILALISRDVVEEDIDNTLRVIDRTILSSPLREELIKALSV